MFGVCSEAVYVLLAERHPVEKNGHDARQVIVYLPTRTDYVLGLPFAHCIYEHEDRVPARVRMLWPLPAVGHAQHWERALKTSRQVPNL